MNQKKPRRLYREEKLQVRKRGGRKRAVGIPCSRQTNAELLCRELQWQPKGRMPQRDALLVVVTGTRSAQQMERGLQPRETTLIAGKLRAQRVRRENGIGKTGCIKPKTIRRILQMAGGDLRLRSPTPQQTWRLPAQRTRKRKLRLQCRWAPIH